jgi:hypothetical protein
MTFPPVLTLTTPKYRVHHSANALILRLSDVATTRRTGVLHAGQQSLARRESDQLPVFGRCGGLPPR